ncbi:MAG: glycoside hydrolase family 92 protein [Sphingobacterium sp.]|nr:glycoside hydrolase family 92 protein [Sphingobacterium sp.]
MSRTSVSGSSVSVTLEYAYDDWCIAQIARCLPTEAATPDHCCIHGPSRRTSILSISEFTAQSPELPERLGCLGGEFMRPRLCQTAPSVKHFDVLSTHGQGFIEGNCVELRPASCLVTLARRYRTCGRQEAVRPSTSTHSSAMELPDGYFAETEDITRDGINRQLRSRERAYAHHVPYLFNYAGEPHRTTVPGATHNGCNVPAGPRTAWAVTTTAGG